MGKVRAFFSRGSRRSRSSFTDDRRPSSAAPSLAPSPSSSTRNPPAPPPASNKDEPERVFRKFDLNGDGRVSQSELASLFASVGHATTDEELARAVAEADADGDGHISLPEFAGVSLRKLLSGVDLPGN